MLGATRKISFLPAVLLILLSGVFLFASAMPMSSTEESTIEALRLRGVSEKQIELLIRPRHPSTQAPFSAVKFSETDTITIPQQPSSTQDKDDVSNGFLSVLWTSIKKAEGENEMRTARWEKVKVESGAGGGKDEDAMVVTGRMGRLKVTRA